IFAQASATIAAASRTTPLPVSVRSARKSGVLTLRDHAVRATQPDLGSCAASATSAFSTKTVRASVRLLTAGAVSPSRPRFAPRELRAHARDLGSVELDRAHHLGAG